MGTPPSCMIHMYNCTVLFACVSHTVPRTCIVLVHMRVLTIGDPCEIQLLVRRCTCASCRHSACTRIRFAERNILNATCEHGWCTPPLCGHMCIWPYS